jgi:hypothetical protein
MIWPLSVYRIAHFIQNVMLSNAFKLIFFLADKVAHFFGICLGHSD